MASGGKGEQLTGKIENRVSGRKTGQASRYRREDGDVETEEAMVGGAVGAAWGLSGGSGATRSQRPVPIHPSQ